MPKTILFLSANPLSTDRLRLDEEVREIDNGLRRAKQRENFVLQQRWALRTEDLRRAMLDFEPEIVHFSGHGTGNDGIVLQDSLGQPSLVSTEALQKFFELFPNVECVLLNACYSEIQAKAIAQHVKYVIGMHQQIGDSAAGKFAVSFYDALGAGKPIEFAYKLGCNAVQMADIPEHLTPILIQRAAIFSEHKTEPKASNAPPRHRRWSSIASWIPIIGAIAMISLVWISYPFPDVGRPEEQPATATLQSPTSAPALASPTRVAMVATDTPAPAVQASETPVSSLTATSQLSIDACPLTVEFGLLIQCAIAKQGDLHLHTFEVKEGDQLYYKVIPTGLHETLSIRVLISGPSGEELYHDLSGQGVERIFRAPTSGVYTMRVEDENLINTGKYALYLQRLGTPIHAQPLITGQPLQASIQASFQHDAYSFVAVAGEQVSIDVDKLTGLLKVQVDIYSPEGKKDYRGIDSSGVPARFIASSSGTYLMLVYDNNMGDYRVLRSR